MWNVECGMSHPYEHSTDIDIKNQRSARRDWLMVPLLAGRVVVPSVIPEHFLSKTVLHRCASFTYRRGTIPTQHASSWTLRASPA